VDLAEWLEQQIEPIRALVMAGDATGPAVDAAIEAASAKGTSPLLHVLRAIGGLFVEEMEYEQAAAHYSRAIAIARDVEFPSIDDAGAILDAHLELLLVAERDDSPPSPALLDSAARAVESLSSAHPGERIAAAAASLRATLGPSFARAGRTAEAEAQERAVIDYHARLHPPDEDALASAELRLARLLASTGRSEEGESIARAIIARNDETSSPPSRTLIDSYATVVGLLDDRGSAEARTFEAAGRALAARHCDEPIAADVLQSLLGPFDCNGDELRWIAGDRVLHESRGGVSNPRALDEHGHPTPDGVRSEVVFGPLRDFACRCVKYDGFRHWGAICEACRVELEASSLRRWRFGHISLAHPVVHPGTVPLIATLLDLHETQVAAIRDFEGALEGERGPIALEIGLRNLDLESEIQRLEQARAQGRLRGRVFSIERRLAVVSAFARAGVQPGSMILHALPVLPPDLDLEAHATLRTIDRSEVERAYGAVLAANADVTRTLAEDAPIVAAARLLQRNVDALFATLSPPQAPPEHTAPAETHVPAFELARGAVARPTFAMGSASLRAGKVFVLDDRSLARPLAVTCLHLFGPAGGLPQQLLSEQVAWTIARATLVDAFDGDDLTVTGRALDVPGARAGDDFSDVAALLLPTPGNARALRLSDNDAANGERVYLAAPVRAGAPASQRLHPATVLATTASGSTLIELDVTDLDLGGTSGAPVLRDPDTVVGMFVRCRKTESSDLLLGTMVPASRLRELLRRAIERPTSRE